MRKILILLLISLFSLFSCNQQYTQVEYGGVSVELPSGWDISNTYKNSQYTITGQYQSRVESQILLINIFENQIIKAHDLAPKIKDGMKELSVYEPLKFYPVKVSDFRGIKVHEMEYSADDYQGRIIIYNDDINTYMLMCQGKKTFLNSEITKHFFESFTTYGKKTDI